jgi:hypothetical protein
MKFSHSLFLLPFVLLSSTVQAQGIFDALQYTAPTFNGSARYMGMAGSLGALGGDVSAVMDNPATLGLFRKSELSFSLNLMPTTSQAVWGGKRSNNSMSDAALNNLSWVVSYLNNRETGYLGSNFIFAYNRIKNFNRRATIAGQPTGNSLTDYVAGMTNGLHYNDLNSYYVYENEDVGYLSALFFGNYLIDPQDNDSTLWRSVLGNGEKSTPAYTLNETGRIEEYNFSYAFNISDYFYLGAGVSLQHINYSRQSVYSETFETSGDFELRNNFHTTGIGWNFRFGAVARPASFLRLGLSLQTSTRYFMHDSFSGEIYSHRSYLEYAPEAGSDYSLRVPLKLQASVGLIAGKKAALNIDYVYSDIRNTNFIADGFLEDNIDIANYTNPVHFLKIGAEVRVQPQMMIRGGFAFSSPQVSETAVKEVPLNTVRTDMEYFLDKNAIYGTLGFGYRKSGLSFDIAYVLRHENQLFMPYETYDKNYAANVKTNYHNIVVTCGLRF